VAAVHPLEDFYPSRTATGKVHIGNHSGVSAWAAIRSSPCHWGGGGLAIRFQPRRPLPACGIKLPVQRHATIDSVDVRPSSVDLAHADALQSCASRTHTLAGRLTSAPRVGKTQKAAKLVTASCTAETRQAHGGAGRPLRCSNCLPSGDRIPARSAPRAQRASICGRR